MSEKVDYTVGEWNTLKMGAVAAGALVMAASPSGSRGQTKERTAMRASGAAALQQVKPGTLLSALVAEVMAALSSESEPGLELRREIDAVQKLDSAGLLNLIREAAAILAAKGTPDEASGYQSILMAVARDAAGAARENTVLGLGGELISPSEQSALDQLAEVLSTPAG